MSEEIKQVYDQFDQAIIGNKTWAELKPSEVNLLFNPETKQEFLAKIEEARKNLVEPLERSAIATGRFQYIYQSEGTELSIREQLVQLGNFFRMNGYTDAQMKELLYESSPDEFSYRNDFEEITHHHSTK
ncbi:MAG: hypothetical protein PUB18_06300 [bacterium]|nr:hypothetical protein [bacterium]